MKKEFKVIGLLVLVAFLCCGCDIKYASTTRDIRHSGFALSGAELECDVLLANPDYDKVKFLTAGHVITESGSVYSLSIGQKYSNDQNCMASTMTTKVVSLFDETIVKGADNKYYYLTRNGDAPQYSMVPNTDSNYGIYDLLLKDQEVLKVKTVDSNTGQYYVLKKDGNVYSYTVSKNGNGGLAIVSTSVVYSKSSYRGTIIDFSYAGKSSGTSVRTTSEIFRMIATNKEECSKYVDVQCEYEMRLDENLTKHQLNIYGFSGSYLITKYGKQFNAVG